MILASSRTHPGKFVALGAVVAFAILMAFILLYRGDHPPERVVEQMSEQAQENVTPAPLPDEVTAPENLDDRAPAGTSSILRATPPAPSAHRHTKSAMDTPKVPRPKLDRPGLALGKKPLFEVPAAELQDEEARLGAAISADEIRRVVHKNQRAVRTCYQGIAPAFLGDSSSGKLEVALKVEPSGEVAEASVRNGVPRSPQSDCVENHARSWKFKAPGGEAAQEVVVPFVIVRGAG